MTANNQMSLAIKRRPLVPEFYESRSLYRMHLGDLHGSKLDDARAARLRESPDAASLAEVEAADRDPDNPRVVARQDAPAIRAEQARLAGGREIIHQEPDRSAGDDAQPPILIFEFHDGAVSIVRDDRRIRHGEYRIKPDDARQYVRIDMLRMIDGRESTMRGIYDLRDDTLRLYIANEAAPRPLGFAMKGLYQGDCATMGDLG